MGLIETVKAKKGKKLKTLDVSKIQIIIHT